MLCREPALREVARVLRPGGRAIAHSDLWQTLGIRALQRRWSMLSPRVLLRGIRAAAGTVLYPWLGRLLLEPSAPVHSTRGQMRRGLARAGLCVHMHESCRIAQEVCYVVAEKAPTSSEAEAASTEHSGPEWGMPSMGRDLRSL